MLFFLGKYFFGVGRLGGVEFCFAFNFSGAEILVGGVSAFVKQGSGVFFWLMHSFFRLYCFVCCKIGGLWRLLFCYRIQYICFRYVYVLYLTQKWALIVDRVSVVGIDTDAESANIC